MGYLCLPHPFSSELLIKLYFVQWGRFPFVAPIKALCQWQFNCFITEWRLTCEQALHLGDIVKSRRARATRDEMLKPEAWKRKAPRGYGAHSRVLAQLALLAQIRELACRLSGDTMFARQKLFCSPLLSYIIQDPFGRNIFTMWGLRQYKFSLLLFQMKVWDHRLALSSSSFMSIAHFLASKHWYSAFYLVCVLLNNIVLSMSYYSLSAHKLHQAYWW